MTSEDHELAADIATRMRLADEDNFEHGVHCLIEAIGACLGQPDQRAAAFAVLPSLELHQGSWTVPRVVDHAAVAAVW